MTADQLHGSAPAGCFDGGPIVADNLIDNVRELTRSCICLARTLATDGS